MAAERIEHPTPSTSEVASPPPSESFRPNETITQTLDRLAGLINGTEGDPLKFWGEAKKRAAAFTEYYEVENAEKNKMTPQKIEGMSKWIEDDEKNENPYLTQAATAMIGFWNKLKPEGQGHPAHDKRHFQKDLTTALEYRDKLIETNDPMGSYQKASLLASFGHDFGRLIEPKALGTPQGAEMGTDHPLLSFAIMADILDNFKEVKADPSKGIAAKAGIPQELRDHILYAVLVHQKWPNPQEGADKRSFPFVFFEPMPRSVMGADRLQLVGPEAIMRFFQFDVGVKPMEATDEKQKALDLATKVNPKKKESLASNTDLVHHAEFYMRNLQPVFIPETLDPTKQKEAADETKVTREANKWIVERAHQQRAETGIFLWLASTDEIREQIYAPELAHDKTPLTDEQKKKLAEQRKKLLPDAVWKQIKEVKDNGLKPEIEQKITQVLGNRTETQFLQASDEEQTQYLKLLANELVQAPNASVTEPELAQIYKKLEAITDKTARTRMARGLAYVLISRHDLETTQDKVIKKIQTDTQHYPPKSLEATFAKFITSIEGRTENNTTNTQPERRPSENTQDNRGQRNQRNGQRKNQGNGQRGNRR